MTVNNFYEQSDKNQQEGPGQKVAFWAYHSPKTRIGNTPKVFCAVNVSGKASGKVSGA
jgi:hypothetical protein